MLSTYIMYRTMEIIDNENAEGHLGFGDCCFGGPIAHEQAAAALCCLVRAAD